MIYLDNAATTLQKPPTVARAMKKALQSCGGAGRGGHQAAMKAADVLLECRQEAALLLGASDPERIVFTMNATHALCTAIGSLSGKPGRVVVSGFEHNAVMRPLEALKSQGFTVKVLQTPLFEPEMALHLFEDALSRDVSFVVCTHVSNVFGYILPIERIAQLCRVRGIPLIVDASQSAGTLPILADEMPGAYFCMPGHKGLYGPQGTGIMVVPEEAPTIPLLRGGTGSRSSDMHMPDFLPDRLEAGTHNMPGIAGLCEGIKFIRHSGVDTILRGERALTSRLVDALLRHRRVRLYRSNHLFCQTGVLSFRIDGMDVECTAERLSKAGCAVRAGLHCAPVAHKTADTYPGGTVRVSFSHFNNTRDVSGFVQAVENIL